MKPILFVFLLTDYAGEFGSTEIVDFDLTADDCIAHMVEHHSEHSGPDSLVPSCEIQYGAMTPEGVDP
jgi:hypothetical protein